MSRPILSDAFGHHVWATIRLIDACLPLTDEELGTPVPGTFGSILDTLRHLVGADCSYLELVSGGEVVTIDEETMDLPALRAAIVANGPVWADVVADELDPDRAVVRRRADGSQSRAPLGIRLAQVIPTTGPTTAVRSVRRSRTSGSRRPRSTPGPSPGRTGATRRCRRRAPEPPSGRQRSRADGRTVPPDPAPPAP